MPPGARPCGWSASGTTTRTWRPISSGGSGVDFSEDSIDVINRLNGTLQDVYAAAGVPMAAVGQAFEMTQSQPVDLAGVGDVPRNVARTCALTWMCTSGSPHAKEHPNDAGYQVIAQAIAAVIPA